MLCLCPGEIDEICNPLTAVDVFLQMMGEIKGGISHSFSVERAFGK